MNETDPLPGGRVADLRRAHGYLQEAMNIFERAHHELPTVMYADFIHHTGPSALLGALKRSLAYRKHVADGTIDSQTDDLKIPGRVSSPAASGG